ncbi:hypothetical protein RHSIM_Rhsim13G0047000 [Rhododendron simsii]|uniref:Uncharacterized protein n=1 Tax=Rhododendron simsii TaxID=118357 RepID=A0A834G018_RHOSS|nr:hypothetical protein RHSIM_Rhsim13G0047000 [Rhododendron simsii]
MAWVPNKVWNSSITPPFFTTKVEDIIASCGLSNQFLVLCKSSENPNAVLNLLRSCGFSRTQVETIVTKYPRILFCKAQENLKPKIDFLRTVGLSETEFLGVVTTSPQLFTRSLKNNLVPLVDFLNLGIPQSQISTMLANTIIGRVITCTKPCRFSEVVSTVMEMGFDPLSSAFKSAVRALLFCNGTTWEGKLVLYKTLGFSDEDFLKMFKISPLKKKCEGDDTSVNSCQNCRSFSVNYSWSAPCWVVVEEGSEGVEEGGGQRRSWWRRLVGDVAVVESGGLEEKGEGKGGPEPAHRFTHRKNQSPYQRLPTLWLLLRVLASLATCLKNSHLCSLLQKVKLNLAHNNELKNSRVH